MSTRARRGRYLAVAGVVLAIAGILALTTALRGQQDAPRPPASAATAIQADPTTTMSSAAAPSTPDRTATRGPILAASPPTALSIPAIGVRSEMHSLGLNPDRTVEVPPLGTDSYAGWYKFSPSPGQLGPSIILGHIDSAEYGPGVFFKLGALRPRDTVSISRADHTVAVFQVERVVQYAKAHFPTAEVYGNTDRAALRLITCGGRFDPSVRSYEDNIVAYASLVSSHHA
jgi:sortase family protein